MPKPFTDAKFEVVTGPDPRLQRKELPEWFKRAALIGASIFMLSAAVYKASQHEVTGSQVAASEIAEPQSQAVR